MKALSISPLLLAMLLLSACVTINVYFPAAAAQEAADRIIKDVYGNQPAAPQPAEPSSQLRTPAFAMVMVGAVLEWLVSPAQAMDIDIQSPGIQRLKSTMTARHQQLAPYYGSGAVGMTRNGEIAVRDLNAVSLRDRAQVSQLVAAENQDRSALYNEIARANQHPEWADDIRKTFARRWVDNAPAGWWYQNEAGAWVQK
ncbi:MAG: YdbL family protein [Xanthomonadaceae bacterium]|nr:YdbL family protein [Xanthomonadaceae bacterium]